MPPLLAAVERFLWLSPPEWEAVWLSLKVSIVAVAASLPFGIAIAWLLARRDRHPLLRALSAPLNLVISILDLAWDQMMEFFGDVWGTLKDWARRSRDWALGLVRRWAWDPMMKGLRWAKEKLARKEEKKED